MEQVNAFNDEREVHNVNFFRKGVNFFRNRVNLFRLSILRNRTFFHRELMRRSLALLSVIGRWNKARYKRGKKDGNLNKSTFFYFGVLRSFLGSSLVLPWSLTRSIYRWYKGIES